MVDPAGAGLDCAKADVAIPTARMVVATILKRIVSSLDDAQFTDANQGEVWLFL
jgi:hypothetical protein